MVHRPSNDLHLSKPIDLDLHLVPRPRAGETRAHPALPPCHRALTFLYGRIRYLTLPGFYLYCPYYYNKTIFSDGDGTPKRRKGYLNLRYRRAGPTSMMDVRQLCGGISLVDSVSHKGT
jgi:hypothetical protein